MSLRFAWAFALLLIVCAPATPAQPPLGAIPRPDGPIRVDGRLDEPAWAHALAIELPFETSPGENTPAQVETVCLLLYDTDRLYVGFRASDPAASGIRAHVADRDAVFRNDYVGILLDPFNDGRRGFEFMVNPLGVQMDASSSDVGGTANGMSSVSGAPAEDFSWDAIWAAAGRITADGYEVEFAIPFSSLRFPATDGPQTWGVLAFRAWPRDVMHKLRSVPFDRNRNCYFCQMATVTGPLGATPGRNIEIDPTFTAARHDERIDFPADPLVQGPVHKELGVSARWGVTPNLSLNAALNPDFSQVEADVAQLSINRQYALFYPEKRPFFLEGADFFNTPFRAVHTRVVIDPEWGGKLTGKEGGNALGTFVARDRVTNILIPGNQGSLSTQIQGGNTSGVFRYRRDVGEASAIGALATAREGEGGYHNRVYGADAYLRLSSTDKLVLQYLRSETAYPDALAAAAAQPTGNFAGTALRLDYSHSERNWGAWLDALSRGRNFRADSGFMPRVDVREVDYGVERYWYGDSQHWFNKLRLTFEGYKGEDEDGRPLGRTYSAGLGYDGPLQSTLRAWYWDSTEYYNGREYDTDSGDLFFNFRPSGDLTASIDVSYGKAIDYEHERPGEQFDASPGLTLNVGRHLYFQLDHTYERFTVDTGLLYRANLTQARAVYQFTTRLFVRAILQRDLVEYGAAAGSGRDENLFSQTLLSYKVNPQTVVFLGYSDTREGLDTGARLLRDRTLFLKLGYALIL